MANSEERANVQVSGRVQGVAFRDATRRKAEELGLTGWVKNLPDGRVEAVFEGPNDTVQEMVEWCESGPPQAEVEDLELQYGEPQEDLGGFEVR